MPGGIRKHSRRQKQNGQAYDGKKSGIRDNVFQQDIRGAGYKDIVKENDMFVKYYKTQKICPESDFLTMIDTLKSDLPASFRITGFRSQANALLKIIKGKYFKELVDLKERKGEALLPKCLDWYPEKFAYQINLTRNHIRREEAYFKLHNFLVSETESGNISRQEAVSMIPPIVLNVEPHHKVLDMCAAPGSKTAQLIEALHAVEDVLPEGFVVANDSDNARCYMLVHNAKRLQSPCYIITNQDAANMPNLKVPSNDKTGMVNVKFDRILCDVPCTGDGTLRKNADIWPKWNAGNGNNLHGLQYRIVKRGLELLQVGGRIVYSTCSLNPVENEAVLHRILKDAGAAVSLVEVKEKVPGLVYSQGMTDWKLSGKHKKDMACSEDMVFYSSYEEVPPSMRSQISPLMFPPLPEEAKQFHLERCIRILPHHQDTGGFFLALLEKKALCPWEAAKKEGEGKEEERTKEPPMKKKRFFGYREDPFVYFKEDEEVFPQIKEYFDLSLPCSSFLTRSADETKKNNLYFTSPAVKDLIVYNHERVKIINTGVKAFSRCENKGASNFYRLAQEGALMTVPFIKNRKLYPSKPDLEILLLKSDIEAPPEISSFSEEFQEQVNALDTGSVAMIYEEKDDDNCGLKIEVVGWKGKMSLRAYVPKNARLHYIRLIDGDTSKFEKNKFEERKERQTETPKKEEESSEDSADIPGETVMTENGNEVFEKDVEKSQNGENGSDVVEKVKNGAAESKIMEQEESVIAT